ncbi:MAG: hypothetical protein HC904_08640 [Blastochloris sp.]|nr:hypothetical protein [Blastochloris sp.]
MPRPAPFRAAILDLGSNSIKFMLAEQRGGTLRIHREQAVTTRLGASLALTGKLSASSIDATLEVLRQCKAQADAYGARTLLAVGTSALRSARNSQDVLSPARKILGRPIEIISGKKEGELVYAGASSNPRWSTRPVLVIDVGGGSVEFVLGAQGQVHRSISLPLGCVRIKDLYLQEQAPDPLGLQNAQQDLQHQIQRRILPHLPPDKNLCVIGTGGTMITLALIHLQADASQHLDHLEGTKLSRQQLTLIRQNLASQSLAQLQSHPSIPASRADIITAGSLIFESCLSALHLPNIHCGTRGLRYGLWRKKLAPQPITRMIYAPA